MFGLNDPAPRAAAPAEATPQPPAPQYIYVQGPPPAAPAAHTTGGGLKWLVGLLVLLTGANLFLVITARQHLDDISSKQADQLNLLTRRMDSSDDHYAQLRGEFDVTREKLGLTQQELARARTLAAGIQQQQQAAVQQLNQAISQKASSQDLNKLQSDANAKFGNLSGDIAGTQKDLEATKEALTGAKGELSGAIARTHDELVALAHRTDRDYFEFNLGRKGARQKIGTVMMQLDKTNTKKNLFTMNLYFDDKMSLHKDRPIDEPIFFYVQGAPSAMELVVNKIAKDSVTGYLSAPKGFFSSVPNVLSQRPGV